MNTCKGQKSLAYQSVQDSLKSCVTLSPGQLPCPPVLPDVVAEFGEDEGEEDDLEDDEDGHVVDARLDRTHRVVVERNEERTLLEKNLF